MQNRSGILLLAIPFLFLFSCGPREEQQLEKLTREDSLNRVLKDLNAKIERNPDDPELYYRRATWYLSNQKPDRALQDIGRAVVLDPDNPEYLITRSDIFLLLGQPGECSNSLMKVLELDPGNNRAVLKLAKLNLIQRDYRGSFERVRQALEKEPLNPEAFYIRGLALLEIGDTAKAVADLQKAVDQDQHYYEALILLGELYSMKKDPLAAGYLRNALKVRPGSREALYMLGMFYQETEQYQPAIETYAVLSLADTAFRGAPYNTGYIYLVYLRDFPRAVEYFSETLKRDPDYAEAWFNRGYAYELMQDYDRAAKDYKKALELKTNYGKAIDGLNRIDRIRAGR
jgi:tetratricopeptide (TPR) repeat protein